LIAHHIRAIVEGPGTRAGVAKIFAGVLSDLRPVRAADATVYVLPANLSAALPASAPTFTPSKKHIGVPHGLHNCVIPPYLKS
jgi:hypothetical protein